MVCDEVVQIGGHGEPLGAAGLGDRDTAPVVQNALLDRARVRETVVPLVLLAGTMTGCGVYGAMQLNKAGGTTIGTSGALQLAVCVVLGAGAMFAAIGASRPLLRAVTVDPAQLPD
ncbi:hypothetical protein [Streptomyces sp. NPDC002328]|uniref:hypothetical protein n=1 Tax=Streptomyces sp. NPDC002328 TaxID=3364642 RepID=UPI0036AEA7FE